MEQMKRQLSNDFNHYNNDKRQKIQSKIENTSFFYLFYYHLFFFAVTTEQRDW